MLSFDMFMNGRDIFDRAHIIAMGALNISICSTNVSKAFLFHGTALRGADRLQFFRGRKSEGCGHLRDLST